VLTGTPILAKDYTKGPPTSTHGLVFFDESARHESAT
jgi:hypothetical protein